MRRNTFILLISILTAACSQISASHADPLHLFILAGQSNMGRLDPNAAFTTLLNQEFGADAVLVVKDAHTAEPIRRWYRDWTPPPGTGRRMAIGPCGNLYEPMIDKIRVALDGRVPDTITFVWLQGENDAQDAVGEVYEESLRALLKQIRRDLGREDMHVVIGRISDHDPQNSRTPHWALVRKAQVAAAESDPYAEWVDTDDLNGDLNEVHYPPEGSLVLGRRFAQAAIRLIHKNPKSTAH